MEDSAYVTWAPDTGILAFFTNGVLPKTLIQDKLQQKECRSMSEFYRKVNKFLKLKNSKEALHKAQGMATNKKNGPGETLDGNKGKEKRK